MRERFNKRMYKSKPKSCLHMFLVVFPKHTTTPVSPSQGGVKLLAICAVEYCSAVKRNELMTHTAWWVTLGGTKLSERSQTQKATHCMLPFLRHSGKTDGCWGCGWGRFDYRQHGQHFRMRTVLCLDCGGGYMTGYVYPSPWNRILQRRQLL